MEFQDQIQDIQLLFKQLSKSQTNQRITVLPAKPDFLNACPEQPRSQIKAKVGLSPMLNAQLFPRNYLNRLQTLKRKMQLSSLKANSWNPTLNSRLGRLKTVQ